jgi:hypothetical protein
MLEKLKELLMQPEPERDPLCDKWVLNLQED